VSAFPDYDRREQSRRFFYQPTRFIAMVGKNRYSPGMDITLQASAIGGSITIPASKSQTIRALLVATFAEGQSIIHNPLDSQDTRSCIAACTALGAVIEPDGTSLRVIGKGLPTEPVTIDCGNSGTTLYLAAGMAAAAAVAVTFTGDAQLRRRPVGELLTALANLGVRIERTTDGKLPLYPPFTITGPILGGQTSIVCHTSQHLSALLLGAPLACSPVVIDVPLLNEKPYVGLTLTWLDQQGLSYARDEAMTHFAINANQHYKPYEAAVAGDYSSASFFFCAAAITGSTLSFHGLHRDDPQGDREILPILQSMGCTVMWKNSCLTVSGPPAGALKGGDFDLNTMPDALPVLAVTACYATGKTVLGNVPQARIKETDRIRCMHTNLEQLGAIVEETEDSLIIHGNGTLNGGICQGFDDHRIIMAMAIASLASRTSITIHGIEAVAVTFPTFFALLEQIKQAKP